MIYKINKNMFFHYLILALIFMLHIFINSDFTYSCFPSFSRSFIQSVIVFIHLLSTVAFISFILKLSFIHRFHLAILSFMFLFIENE